MRDHGFSVDYPPHSDPRNFLLGWEEWHGFPFRGVDIVEGRSAHNRDGLGPPDRIGVVSGEACAQRLPAHRQHSGRWTPPTPSATPARRPWRRPGPPPRAWATPTTTWSWWSGWTSGSALPDCPTTFTTDAIALNVQRRPRQVGHLMKGLFGDVERAQDSQGRWRTAVMRDAIVDKFNFGD